MERTFFGKKMQSKGDPADPATRNSLAGAVSVRAPVQSFSSIILSPSADSRSLSDLAERSPLEPACLSKTSLVIGTLDFPGKVRIDGRLEGTLRAYDGIIVGVTGMVTTLQPIEAAEVIIAGTVKGGIVASRRIEIKATASVSGDLTAPIVAIEAGAVVEGHCSTTAAKPGSDSVNRAAAQGDAADPDRSIGFPTVREMILR